VWTFIIECNCNSDVKEIQSSNLESAIISHAYLPTRDNIEECRLLGCGASLADFLPSETSVHTRSTRHHIPEDGILHSHRCENLKSYTANNIVYL
jgi:hypothetical protein